MVLQAFPATMPPSLALSEHRHLRMATLFLLYVAQGLPLGLMEFALPAWMAQSGASAAAIGAVLAALMPPWTFKLAYGFLMDRYAFLAMGRRRPTSCWPPTRPCRALSRWCCGGLTISSLTAGQLRKPWR